MAQTTGEAPDEDLILRNVAQLRGPRFRTMQFQVLRCVYSRSIDEFEVEMDWHRHSMWVTATPVFRSSR